MAARITVHSVLDKISKDHLECPICTNRFINPTMLDCLHSFCFTCLKELHQQDPNNSILLCPLCRKKTTLEDNKVDSLPKDFKLNALVDEFTVQEQLIEGHGSEVKCQACKRDHTAVSRCIDCEHFICHECQQAHQHMAILESHKIYSLAQLQSGVVTYRSKIREYIPKCGKHSDQTLNIYCNTCQKLECTTCTILDHANQTHDPIGIPEALDKCKQEVAELVAKAEKCKADIQTAMEQASESCKKLESSYAETNMKISQKAVKERAKITEEEKQLKQEAESVYKDRVQTFVTAEATNTKEVTQVEHKLDEVNQFMTQASSHEILDFKLKLVNNLDELTKIQGEIVSDRLSFLEFEEGERSVGRLVLEDEQQAKAEAQAKEHETIHTKQEWELKESFSTLDFPEFQMVRFVAAFSDNEIVVLDINIYQFAFSTLKPQVAANTSQSTHCPQRFKLKGLSEPSALTVGNNDHLYVIDNLEVKVFNRKYMPLYQFQLMVRNFSPSRLAVDENNLIAVGYSEGQKISLYNPDGSLIRTFSTPVRADYLTLYNERIIYNRRGNKHLHSVDYQGGKVFSVDIDQSEGSWGICCDKDGSIFVAQFDGGTNRICQYSPDGKYIGCVIEECGHAYDITFTPSGNLVVAAEQSVNIFQVVSQ
ncbi:tripartite motif-containing protein 42-like isoform X1 [Asterias rubens]|uniref:tripartite motif-containing protein 42-like isoform X1 n=1 Tax=Asterias rubens TaxID=7604 RepID=UPI00145591A7|nr:tripartite motif-containing protein 42-like isoform X1 [Asterias rubens]